MRQTFNNLLYETEHLSILCFFEIRMAWNLFEDFYQRAKSNNLLWTKSRYIFLIQVHGSLLHIFILFIETPFTRVNDFRLQKKLFWQVEKNSFLLRCFSIKQSEKPILKSALFPYILPPSSVFKGINIYIFYPQLTKN